MSTKFYHVVCFETDAYGAWIEPQKSCFGRVRRALIAEMVAWLRDTLTRRFEREGLHDCITSLEFELQKLVTALETPAPHGGPCDVADACVVATGELHWKSVFIYEVSCGGDGGAGGGMD